MAEEASKNMLKGKELDEDYEEKTLDSFTKPAKTPSTEFMGLLNSTSAQGESENLTALLQPNPG